MARETPFCSRADPAPVADEAAIEKWRKDATRVPMATQSIQGKWHEIDGQFEVSADTIDEAVRLMRARLPASDA